jgi:cob(I)alamin adenosyltransferase
VGELSTAAGVSVRTLHHYDRIGLLVPSERSASGHRRYAAADVRRLYRIVALRSLGFELAMIREMLDSSSSASLLEVAGLQLERVEEHLRATTAVRDHLARIVASLEHSGGPSLTDLINAMEAIAVTVRLTRIYTRTGDEGKTSLGDRARVLKTHPRIEAGGAVDELNAHIGLALATGELEADHAAWLLRIQSELFDLGADLSVPRHDGEQPRLRITADYVSRLEQACDAINRSLEPLDSFVVPGGSIAAGCLHVARTVCRRAERRALDVEGVNPEILRYLNRLSDLLFIVSRAVAAEQPLWQPTGGAA